MAEAEWVLHGEVAVGDVGVRRWVVWRNDVDFGVAKVMAL